MILNEFEIWKKEMKRKMKWNDFNKIKEEINE